MATIRATEDEFKSQLITWLNEFISHGNYPLEEATGGVSMKTSKFTKYSWWKGDVRAGIQ